nr:thermonuclease family protein [Pleomorphomonas sp. T1.2MG-36]
MRLIRAWLPTCCIIGTLFLAANATSAEIIGRASTVDGDTIEIHGARIRLDGVDAPESYQICLANSGRTYRCGQASASELAAFMASAQPVSCLPTGRSYDRIVAICRRADGVEINQWLVASGYAVDWPKYSQGRYADVERSARNSRLGIWSGSFQMPCSVRRTKC